MGKASIRGVHISPRKLRIIANMVRGKSVNEAMGILRLVPKKGAGIVEKLLFSAVCNASGEHRVQIDEASLRVTMICVDNGPVTKRWMPRAMGRANRINHRSSHLAIVVAE